MIFFGKRRKERFISAAHVHSTRLGKGDGQNRARVDLMMEDHIGDARDHNGGFSGAGNRQQKNRPLNGLSGLQLLRGQ